MTIKNLEKKYNVSIIFDQYERTYAIYKDNKVLAHPSTISGIQEFLSFKFD